MRSLLRIDTFNISRFYKYQIAIYSTVEKDASGSFRLASVSVDRNSGVDSRYSVAFDHFFVVL